MKIVYKAEFDSKYSEDGYTWTRNFTGYVYVYIKEEVIGFEKLLDILK